MYETAKEERESYERQKRRKGKYDWEICKGKIPIGSKYAIYLALECNNLFRTGLQGLKITWHWAVRDGIGFIYKKYGVIPLSWYAFKIERMAKKAREGKLKL